MIKPNLFLVGAPKCATTALSKWLGEHPHIFITSPKEPCYFNSDVGVNNIHSWEEYTQLYDNVQEDHQFFGEASTVYMYSKTAIDHILALNPDAKILAAVRNPVDVALALHNEELRSFNEDLASFEDAWEAQSPRREGQAIPAGCKSSSLLQYRERSSLGTQIEVLTQKVPEGNLKIVFFDDIKSNPSHVYADILSFLGLENDGRTDFGVQNARGHWRSMAIQRGIRALARFKNRYITKHRFGVLSRFSALNRAPANDNQTPSDTRRRLTAEFQDEIQLIQAVTGRDLSHWLRCDS